MTMMRKWEAKCHRCLHKYSGDTIEETELGQGRFAFCPSCGARNLIEVYPDECPGCGMPWHQCLCYHDESDDC